MMRTIIGAALMLALALPAHAQAVKIGSTHIGAGARAHPWHPLHKMAAPRRLLFGGALIPTNSCNPGFVTGQIPSSQQWNAAIGCGFPSIGGLLGGALGLPASTTLSAPLNISPGSAPTSPNNGDIWATSAGVFIQVNGSTVGPLGTGGGGGGGTITLGSTPIAGFTSGDVLEANGSVVGQVAASTTVFGSTCTLGGTCSPVVALTNLATEAANTVVGNAAGSSAAPTALSMPSCSGASNALIWTSAVGFGCNTISGGSGLTQSLRRITTGTSDSATDTGTFATIVVALGTPAAFVETLPACVSGNNQQRFTIKDALGQAGANPITVKATTSTVDTIAGATGFIMNSNFESVGFQCDSAAASGNWMAE
jgi:hypothetical protein